MTVSRRTALTEVGLVGAVLATSSAQACTLIARMKPICFSDTKCRRSLRGLLDLINAAPTLSPADLSTRADELAVDFDDSVSEQILPNVDIYPIENADLISGWSLSAGKRDRSPIILHEVNLLKGEKGIALYQFALRRDAYHEKVSEEEAASDSCGMGPVDAFYGSEINSYLGFFRNNKLREVSVFDAWLRTA